jgi:hypothetical protein
MIPLLVSLAVATILLVTDGVHDLYLRQSPWPSWAAALTMSGVDLFFAVLYLKGL